MSKYDQLIAEAREPWRCALGVSRAKPPIVMQLVDALEHMLRDRNHWKSNHETEVRRARMLKDRIDMPLERVQAYKQWGLDLMELSAFRDEWVALDAEISALRAEVKSLRARLVVAEPPEREIC